MNLWNSEVLKMTEVIQLLPLKTEGRHLLLSTGGNALTPGMNAKTCVITYLYYKYP